MSAMREEDQVLAPINPATAGHPPPGAALHPGPGQPTFPRPPAPMYLAPASTTVYNTDRIMHQTNYNYYGPVINSSQTQEVPPNKESEEKEDSNNQEAKLDKNNSETSIENESETDEGELKANEGEFIKMKPAIGIDLGTTYSCVAVFKDGKPQVIPNSLGGRVTPSVVAYTEKGRLVGNAARRYMKEDPANTIHNAKRFIGRTWDDPKVQEKVKSSMYPFKIKESHNKIYFETVCNSKTEILIPEKIGAEVLREMKKTAEDYLEEPIKDAVITVPAYFTDSQRKATKDAGKIAGLNVIRIINEPSAAAMAYGLREGTDEFEGKKYLVYDLGGGTFDISVLAVETNLIKVKATAGNSDLGGEDFTELLVQHFQGELKQKYNMEIEKNDKKMERLRRACETLKRNLSMELDSKIELDEFLPNDLKFISNMTREEFENLCQDKFEETILEVEKALKCAKVSKDNVQEVILVGGSTRIPKLQSMLRNFFNNKKKLNRSINEDEVVACGAAIQAAILNQDPHISVTEMVFMDVNPLSLGVNTQGEITTIVVERNTPIPVKETCVLSTVENNQTTMPFKITEGERIKTKDNTFLGEFFLQDLPAKKAGTVFVDLVFEIDANGILQVSATETETGKNASVTLNKRSSGNQSQEEIEKLVEKAENSWELDQAEEERVNSMNKLTSLCNHIKFISIKHPKEKAKDILQSVEICSAWLQENSEANKQEFESRYEDLSKEAVDIFKKSSFIESSPTSQVLRMSKKYANATYCLTEGKELLRSENMNDKIKARENFYTAYNIANKKGNHAHEIESIQLLGHTYRMISETLPQNDKQNKLFYAIDLITTLSFALTLNRNMSLGDNDLHVIIQDIQFGAEEFFNLIDDLQQKEKSSAMDRVIRVLENRKNIENKIWNQIAFKCWVKEIDILLANLTDSLKEEDAKNAKSYIRDLKHPREQAQFHIRTENEKRELDDRISCIQELDNHTSGLQEINYAVDQLDDIDKKDNHDVIVDKALGALDHLKEAKRRTKGTHDKVYIKATFFEAMVFMEHIMNSKKAQSLFEEVKRLSEVNNLNTEEYRKSKDLLKQLQQEQAKLKEDRKNKSGVNKEKILEELQPDLQRLNDADKTMSDKKFAKFLFETFPPKHKKDFKEPNLKQIESAYLRLSTFYHPDKVIVAVHGDKYKIMCEKILKCINRRYSRMES